MVVVALINHVPADDVPTVSANVGQDVDLVFLAPMKVNTSSSSLTVKSPSGTVAAW